MTPRDVCEMGLECARVPATGRRQMSAVEPPVWVEASVGPETLSHCVLVEWLGQRMFVLGQHLGPKPGDFSWSHEESNPEQHWMLEWQTAGDEHNDPDELPADVRDQLPSEHAWQHTGEWLLGILMVQRLSGARVTSEDLTLGIAETWGQFVEGFAEE